jgi:hypothetical protein
MGGLPELKLQFFQIHGFTAPANCPENPDGSTCQLGRSVATIVFDSVYLPVKPIHERRSSSLRFQIVDFGELCLLITGQVDLAKPKILSASQANSEITELSFASLRNWNNGIMECWNIGLIASR